MPSYQTMVIRPDEKSSLLGAEFLRYHPELVGTSPVVSGHCYDTESACSAHRRHGGSRKRSSGCCARLCQFLLCAVFGTIAVLFVIRQVNSRGVQLPYYWDLDALIEGQVVARECPSAPFSYKNGELKYEFDVGVNAAPNGFSFGQRWIRKPGSSTGGGAGAPFVQTAGNVLVRAAPASASHPITVELDVKLSHQELADAVNVRSTPHGLSFESEPFLRSSLVGVDPCIAVVATIFVAPSANLSSFEIDTATLPVQLEKTLELVSRNVFIHSTAGGVSSETTKLSSTAIEIETNTNDIIGSFPLRNLLSLRTGSGLVNVNVEPLQASAEGDEHGAGVLTIRTTSGNVNVVTDVSAIPNRNFTTQVHTVSGSIGGNFLLGASSTLDTASGSINANFYTAGDIAERSWILNSVSGAVHGAVFDDSFKLGTLRSNAMSQTGSVDLQLPSAWEGKFQGETKTGSIDITGTGVEIIRDILPVPGLAHIVIAQKGLGLSNLSAKTLSAPITVRVG